MDLQTVLQVVADFQQHAWWPLALLLVLWARKVLSDDSSFRLSVPPRYLHVVTAGLTTLTVFVTAEVDHKAIGVAIVGALVAGIGSGLADGMLTAFFADPSKVPGWAKTLVMLVDELGGEPPPVASKRGFVRVGPVFGLSLGAIVLVVACGAGQIFGPGSKIPADLQAEEQCVSTQLINGNTDPKAIALNCSMQEGAILTDLIAYLLPKLGDKVPAATRTKMGTYVATRRAAGDQ